MPQPAEDDVQRRPRRRRHVGQLDSVRRRGWKSTCDRRIPPSLAAVDASFQKAVDTAVVEENQRWGKPGVITVVKELVGDRPAGSTPENSPIVRAGLATATAARVSAPTSAKGRPTRTCR